ncbi:MAG TPA: protein translocase subunit SecF [Herpetosiphonaceae bacterium]
MIDLVRRRYLWFLISILTIIPGMLALLFFGLRLGIDFEGGTRWEIHFPTQTQAPAGFETQVGDLFRRHEVEPSRINTSQGATGGQTFAIALVSTPTINSDDPKKAEIEQDLRQTFGEPTRLESFQTVGSTVRSRAIRDAIIAVLFASGVILIYMWMAFRGTPNAIRYGVCAIIAMLHDVLVVIGIAAILGKLINLEVDALFLTAVLTVISFSIHDTIVVFDRIRENLRRSSESFESIVNRSVVQTLTRSINTQFTSVFTLTSLLLFGGASIRSFVLILLIGLLSGTYSSIFNAAQMLVVWENREWQGWFGKKPSKPATAA